MWSNGFVNEKMNLRMKKWIFSARKKSNRFSQVKKCISEEEII